MFNVSNSSTNLGLNLFGLDNIANIRGRMFSRGVCDGLYDVNTSSIHVTLHIDL